MKHRNCYITMVEITDLQHRSKVIIHTIPLNYFAEFDNMEQLKKLSEMLGFSFEPQEEKKTPNNGVLKLYSMSHNIVEGWESNFWNRNEIPESAKPFIASSNGSVVTCYFTNNGDTITIYRPNPNAKDVYQPLPLNEHIKHRKEMGTY